MHEYGQIAQNYHTLVLFDSPNMENLMTPAGTQITLVLIGKGPFLEAKQRTNGFQEEKDCTSQDRHFKV